MKIGEVGSIGKAELTVKYGKPFPKINDEKIISGYRGKFKVKITNISTPYWTDKVDVLVPVQFRVLEVVELSSKQKAENIDLRLV